MFATLFYGILHTDTGEVEYCIAGHNPPYIMSKSGELRMVTDPAGMIAGAFEIATYETGRIQLNPDDVIFLFTDGVTEAANTTGEFFSEERLKTSLERMPGASAEEIVSNVVGEVRIFSSGAAQSDDITAMALTFRNPL